MKSSRKIKICIVGSSVGLRCRPVSDILNYGQLLDENERIQLNVVNLSLGRYTSREVLSSRDIFIREYADLYIINIGAVDAPSREIPFWFSDILYNRRKSIFYKFLNTIYFGFISKYRRVFTFLRFKKSWISLNEFKNNIIKLIESIQKDTKGKILILGINSGNSRVEKQLPGTMKKYNQYNKELKNIALARNIGFVDVSKLDSESYFPDGVHYNDEGHKFINNQIIKHLIEV